MRRATVNVKFCVALGGVALLAVKVRGQVPPVPAAGVPDNTRVPLLKVTPLGRRPLTLTDGAGVPVVVTVNEPGDPTVNVAAAPLVTAGATPGSCGVTLTDAEDAPVPAALVAVTLQE